MGKNFSLPQLVLTSSIRAKSVAALFFLLAPLAPQAGKALIDKRYVFGDASGVLFTSSPERNIKHYYICHISDPPYHSFILVPSVIIGKAQKGVEVVAAKSRRMT